MLRRTLLAIAVLGAGLLLVRLWPEGQGRSARDAAPSMFARGEVLAVDEPGQRIQVRRAMAPSEPVLTISVLPERTHVLRGRADASVAEIHPGDFVTVRLDPEQPTLALEVRIALPR